MLRVGRLLPRAVLPAAVVLFGKATDGAECMPVLTIQRTDAPVFLQHRDPMGAESGVQTVSSPARKQAQTECENYARRLLELVRVPHGWAQVLEKSGVLSPSDFFSYFSRVHPRVKNADVKDQDIDNIFNDLQDEFVRRDGRNVPGDVSIEAIRAQNGLPRSFNQCVQQTEAIVEKYREHSDAVEKLHLKTLDRASKEDRTNAGDDSDIDDEFNASARSGKRREARADRLKRNSERCQSNACVLMRQPLLFSGTVASDETISAITRSQTDKEPAFPGRELKWAMRGDVPLKLDPATPAEAIQTVALIINSLMVGSCVKVNDGKYLKASFQALQVSQHFQVPEFGVAAEDFAVIPVWVDAFRNWQFLHVMMTAQHKLSARESIEYFWHLLDDVREWQRVEKQPASVYLAKQVVGSEWRRVEHILSASSIRDRGSSSTVTPRTEHCHHFAMGECRRANCKFLHDFSQQKSRSSRPSAMSRRPRFEERSRSRGRDDERGRSVSRGREGERGDRSRGTPHPKRRGSREASASRGGSREGSRSRAATDADSRAGE